MRCSLDTDVVSELLRGRNAPITQKGNAYRQQYLRYTISTVTRYEVLRGLKAKRATKQLAVFEAWCVKNEVLPIVDEIIVLASDLWAALRRSGQIIGDNDILIAATALHHGLALATRNVAHFSRIPGLAILDWSQP